MQSRVLETAIGMVFVWLSASLIVSGIVEAIASLVRMRAKDLEGALERMLKTNANLEAFAKKIAAFDLGKKMAAFNVGKPKASKIRFAKSIPSPAFADAVLRLEKELGKAKFEATPIGDVVKTLRTEAVADAKKVRDELEKWFDHQMEFVSAEYKRRARWISAIAGLLVAIVLGLDTFGVAARLYESKDIRDSLVNASSQFVESPLPATGCVTPTTTKTGSTPASTKATSPPTTTPGDALKAQVQCVSDIASQLTDLKLTTPPLAPWTNICDWFHRRVHHGWGILATAIAIGAGAPFWFRLLKKLLDLRKTKAA